MLMKGNMARSIYSGMKSLLTPDRCRQWYVIFSVHSMGSIESAIVFVVSVTLAKVSKVIQIHTIHAEKGHLVDRMRIFSAAAYRIGRGGVDRCEYFQRFVTRLYQRSVSREAVVRSSTGKFSSARQNDTNMRLLNRIG